MCDWFALVWTCCDASKPSVRQPSSTLTALWQKVIRGVQIGQKLTGNFN